MHFFPATLARDFHSSNGVTAVLTCLTRVLVTAEAALVFAIWWILHAEHNVTLGLIKLDIVGSLSQSCGLFTPTSCWTTSSVLFHILVLWIFLLRRKWRGFKILMLTIMEPLHLLWPPGVESYVKLLLFFFFFFSHVRGECIKLWRGGERTWNVVK